MNTIKNKIYNKQHKRWLYSQTG